jgi:hypothetical protein
LVHAEKQRPHNELTREPDKSYLLARVDAQELFDKYAGTGKLIIQNSGKFSNKEWIEGDDFVGYAVSGTEKVLTKSFKIHHSRFRTHIVPYASPKGVS